MRRYRSTEDLPETTSRTNRLSRLWRKYRRVTMSDMQSIKQAEERHQLSQINHSPHGQELPRSPTSHGQELQRSHSIGEGDERGKKKVLNHRNSWPANHNEPVSPRGPMKSHVARMKEELQEVKENSGDSQTTTSNNEEYEGFPEPEKQHHLIENLDTECTCTYAVSKLWYAKWEEYCGVPKGSKPGASEKPGPIEMDTHNDSNNEYISEEIWKRLVHWYGVSHIHQLDRKHLYFKDEKMFDVCILSPFSGIVEHNVKKFNRFEEIGYIECQLRRIFHVADYRKSRLWISEKAQVPRFRQLLLRFRMLNDCIHRDKVYILALEECHGNDVWPTGEPGEPKGDLTKYKDLISGPVSEEFWNQQIIQSLEIVQKSIADTVRQTMDSFLHNSKSLLQEKEVSIDHSRKLLECKLEETKTKEALLTEQEAGFSQKEQKLQEEREKFEKEQKEFEERREKFDEELKKMESLHEIQETKIKLDVGGQIYTTSIQTLRRDPESMLAAMFSGRYDLKKEADGSYFIDRDGTYFRYVLNFLRDGHLDPGTVPNDSVAVKEIHREAKYYQLTELVTYLEELLQNLPNGNSK